MNIILIFVIIPIATIIFALALQKLLKCPALVAGIFLAVFLILAYTVFTTSFLILAIVYTILAYITAVIAELICKIRRRLERRCCDNDSRSQTEVINVGNNNSDDCNNVLSLISRNLSALNSGDFGCDDNGRSCRCNNCNGNSSCGCNNSNGDDDWGCSNSNNSCSCSNCNGNNNNGNSNDTDTVNVLLNAEVQPNSNNNGRTGSFRGCYRRRC